MEVITVTKNGQITLPENLIKQLKLHEESKLSLKIEAGRLILTPITEDVELLEQDGILTFSAHLTTNEDINTLIEKLRY